eukprot:gene20053-22791_t
MISIQYSQIPTYLQKGGFYRNLIDSDGDEEIQIPEICYSPDDTVDSLQKLEKTLQVAAFWLLDSIPKGVIKYCYENKFSSWCNTVGSKYGLKIYQFERLVHQEDVELAFAQTLWAVFNGNNAFAQAVELGVDEVVEYLIERKNARRTVDYTIIAAHAGRVDILKRLHQNNFPWNSRSCRLAAARGHLDCLQYLHENCCPWDDDLYMDVSEISCVQYAFEHGLPWHPKVAVAFASSNGVELLQYAFDHGCVLVYEAAKVAAYYGHVEALRFLHEHGCEWDSRIYLEAAIKSHLSIVQYAVENNLEWHPDTCERLAMNGNLEILHYAVQHGCPLTSMAANLCATNGYADCLRCLLEAGCSLDANVCMRACMSGHVECLRLLHQHGEECDTESARAAAKYQKWDCLKYLCEHGCPMDHTMTLEAVKKGEVDALHCAMENGCPYPDDLLYEAAASEKNASMSLRYLVEEQGIYMNEDKSLFVAAFARGDFECVQYLVDVGYDCNTCGESGVDWWEPFLMEHD